jgi:hypothetical protein
MILGLFAAAGLSTLLHLMLVGPEMADILFGVPFYDPVTFVGLMGRFYDWFNRRFARSTEGYLRGPAC